MIMEKSGKSKKLVGNKEREKRAGKNAIGHSDFWGTQ
jgi:hypothetical protein